MSFNVVHILETNDVEPCPYLWEENGTLYWPPTSHLVRKLQSTATSKPDKKSWKKYTCVVKERNILLFMYASASCEQYINTTTTEVSEDSTSEGERIQKPNKKILLSKKDVSKYSDFVQKASNKPKKVVVPAKTEAKSKYNFVPNKLQTKENQVTKTPLKKQETPKKSEVIVKEKQAPFIMQDLGHDEALINSPTAPQELMDVKTQIEELFNFVKQWKGDLENKFRDLSIRLDKLEELIQKRSYDIAESSDDDLDLFPINLSKDLLQFDKELNNLDFKKKILLHLSKLIGAGPMTAKAACYKICNSMFSRELLTQFSWTGMSRNFTKHSFQKLKNVLDIFYKLVYKSDQSFSYAQRDAFFRDGILKHSHTRLSQPWKIKKQKAHQNEVERKVDKQGEVEQEELEQEVEQEAFEQYKAEEGEEECVVIQTLQEGDDLHYC